MPQFMQQLQNPAVQSMMTNPEALAAINQVQQGLQRLQAASPDLYRSDTTTCASFLVNHTQLHSL